MHGSLSSLCVALRPMKMWEARSARRFLLVIEPSGVAAETAHIHQAMFIGA